MKKHILLASVLGALTLPAMAEGFYVLGDVGQSKMEFDAGDYTISKTDTAWSLGAGYDFNNFFAVEVAYRDLGSIHENGSDSDEFGDYDYSDKLSATAVQASVVGKLPISDVFSVYGRAGVATIDFDYRSTIGDFTAKDSESRTRGFAGVGASFDVTPQFSLRAEYSQYAKIDDAKLSALTVGATYHF